MNPNLPRGLTFPLYNPEYIEAVINDDSPSVLTLTDLFPTDPDERADIVINVSLNEYVALASSLDVGRDIAYNAESINQWWIWSRMLVSNFCEKMIDCIENDPDVQNALASSVLNGNLDSPPTESRLETVAVEDITCDNDVMWGQSKALWEYINQRNIDFLEVISATTNQAELIASVVEALPVVGLLPVDEIIAYVAQIGDWTLENYNATITTDFQNEIICDIFCIATLECSLTVGQVYEYFIGKLDDPITILATARDLFFYALSGVFVSESLVYLLSLVQIGLVSIGETYLGVNTLNAYAVQAKIGDPDDDWELVCDTCPPPQWEQEFTYETIPSLESFEVCVKGTWDTTKWIGVNSTLGGSNWNKSVGLNVEFGAEVTIEGIQIDISVTAGGTSGGGAVPALAFREDNCTGENFFAPTVTQNNAATYNWTGSITLESFGIWLNSARSTTSSQTASAVCEISRVKISGVGINPFI